MYGLVHTVATVLLWKSPAAVVSLAVLCGGDGLAEVVGRSVPSPHLPWNPNKVSAALWHLHTRRSMSTTREEQYMNEASVGGRHVQLTNA